MDNSSKSDGNEKLFLHLRRQADLNSIYKLCKVMMSKDGYQNMKRLGQEMKNYLDLLTSMYDMCVWYVHSKRGGLAYTQSLWCAVFIKTAQNAM